MKPYFVTITATYLDNGQDYHAFEGLVIASDTEVAEAIALENCSLVPTGETEWSMTGSGESADNPTFWLKDELDKHEDEREKLVIREVYATDFISHLLEEAYTEDGRVVIDEPAKDLIREALLLAVEERV